MARKAKSAETNPSISGSSVEEDQRFKGAGKKVLWWIYETESAGANGVLVVHQEAFHAWHEAERLLDLPVTALTIVQGGEVTIPCKLSIPLIGAIIVIKEEKPKPAASTNGRGR